MVRWATASIAPVVVVAVLGATAATAVAADAPGELGERIRGMEPASAEGAAEVTDLLRRRLVVAPAEVDAEARAVCERYMNVAVEALSRGEGDSCAERVAGRETRAMCRWLNGDDEGARSDVEALVGLDCDEGPDGAERAASLAERWLWAEPLRRVLRASSERSASPVSEELERASERRRDVERAFGDHELQEGLLVVARPSGPAASAGLRPGDVVVSVEAQPVASRARLDEELAGDEGRAFLYYREGERREGTWRGGPDGVELQPVPERLAGD